MARNSRIAATPPVKVDLSGELICQLGQGAITLDFAPHGVFYIAHRGIPFAVIRVFLEIGVLWKLIGKGNGHWAIRGGSVTIY
jgi:hypothetical protein